MYASDRRAGCHADGRSSRIADLRLESTCKLGVHYSVGLGIERGEQAGGAVAEIIVSSAFGLTGTHRQQGRGVFKCLNLALFVDA